MKFAAIDIGTNAVRLLLSRVIEDGSSPLFKKEALMRMPLRLGEDAFSTGRISEQKIDLLSRTMTGFNHLIQAYPALDYMAVATSAMREAENGPEVVSIVKERSGIIVDIIDGQRESQVIYANHIEKILNSKRDYIYVDVGGGSTEVIIIVNGEVINSRSFKIGTVRMLQGGVGDEVWLDLKKWLKASTPDSKSIFGIGSGGNINKIFKLAQVNDGKPISYKRIKEMNTYLSSFTLDERISKLNLRPDRADVITHASKIYLSVMKWARIKWMFVPQFGLPDGIIHLLYKRYFEQNG